MLARLPALGGKLTRGAKGTWQVVEVAFSHTGQQLLTRARPSTWTTVSSITAEIVDADVVSFDLYDTLMARTVDDPDLVHTAVRLVATERGVAVPADWEEIRLQAEAAARARSTRADIRYDDIYDRISVNPATLAILKELELEVEVACMRRTRRGATLFDAARAAGKRVVVTSDMYLPKELLRRILQEGRFAGEESVLASGDDGVAKQDGSTFLHLARAYAGQTVLHIGDNPTKDVERAEGSGVRARLLPRPLPAPRTGWLRRGRRQATVEALQASVLRGLHEAHLDAAGEDDPHRDVRSIGYNVLGPLLVGFSTYLDQEARARGADRLVFLAREGAVMQRGYDSQLGAAALDHEYGVLSSRILGLANLSRDFSVEDVRFLTKSSIALTPEQFVRRVIPQIDPDRLTSALRTAGLAAGQRIHGRRAETVLPPLFDVLRADLTRVVEDTREPLTQYLKSLDLEDPHTLVVDSGWVGTLQHAMGELLGVTVGGIYLGVHDTPASRSRPTMSGWVDGRRGGEHDAMLRTLYAHVQPLEVLMANPGVGSVIGISPETADSEAYAFSYLASEFTQGAQATVARMQDAALDFVADWKSAVTGLGDSTGALGLEPAMAPTLELMTRPTLNQYRALGELPFDGTYGVRPTVLGRWWVPDQFRRRI